jgi:hypothetical protein
MMNSIRITWRLTAWWLLTAFCLRLSAAPQPGVDMSPFASQIVWPDNPNLVTYANHLQAAGVRCARSELIWWSLCESSPGVYNFAPGAWNCYLWINLLKARNIKPYCILCYSNPLYGGTPDTPAGRAAFANYCSAVVTQFRDDVDIWEIWNEPNLDMFWGKTPNAADYAALVAAAAPAIRAADPDCIVVGGATSGIDRTFLDAAFDAGMLAHLDVLSVHPYRIQNPESINSEIASLRAKMNTYPNGPQVKIWTGEWGYNAAWTELGSTVADRETNQAKMLQRMMLNNVTQGIELSMWFSVHGWDPLEDWGLTKWNSPATTRASHTAMTTLQQRLPVPFSHVGNPMSVTPSSPVSGLRIETFDRSTSQTRTVAIWRPRALSFPAPSVVRNMTFTVGPQYRLSAYDGLTGAEFALDARWNIPAGTVTVMNQGLYDYPLFFEVNREVLPVGDKLTAAQITGHQTDSALVGFTGNYAYDGVITVGSKWTSQNTAPPHWLALEFARAFEITGFALRLPAMAGEQSFFNAEDVVFQTAPDFSGPWTTVANATNALQHDRIISILGTPVPARYARLVVNDPGIDNYARIQEFEVYVADLPVTVSRFTAE